MHLTKEQVFPGLETQTWNVISFVTGEYLQAADLNEPLTLKNGENIILVQGTLDEVYPYLEKLIPKCFWCGKEPAIQAMSDGLLVGASCLPSVQLYYQCVQCGDELLANLGTLARRQFERKCCGSDACRRKEDIKYGRICCETAEWIPCVCAYSYKCPIHAPNGMHIGSHD